MTKRVFHVGSENVVLPGSCHSCTVDSTPLKTVVALPAITTYPPLPALGCNCEPAPSAASGRTTSNSSSPRRADCCSARSAATCHHALCAPLLPAAAAAAMASACKGALGSAASPATCVGRHRPSDSAH